MLEIHDATKSSIEDNKNKEHGIEATVSKELHVLGDCIAQSLELIHNLQENLKEVTEKNDELRESYLDMRKEFDYECNSRIIGDKEIERLQKVLNEKNHKLSVNKFHIGALYFISITLLIILIIVLLGI